MFCSIALICRFSENLIINQYNKVYIQSINISLFSVVGNVQYFLNC